MLEIRNPELRQGMSTQTAYDHFYEERNLMMRDSFYLWLLELLHPQPGSMLLDISCGQGRLVQLAAQGGIDAVGVDFSIQGLLKGARMAPAVHWVVGDGEQLPLPDNSIDSVMHIGSLEHYENPLHGVSEIARVLSARGQACILLPNSFGLLGNIRYVWQHGEIFNDGQPLQRYGTRRTWEALLQQGGLSIEKTVPFGEVNFPRTLKDWMWTLARPQKWLRAGLAKLTPINLANHFVFICRAASAPSSPDLYPMLPSYSYR